jgi:uncharacterized membrane protein YcaP (DUF421 family)
MVHAISLLAQAAPTDTAYARMWVTQFPWWEFVFRGVVVYVMVLILLRITGKRQVGQLAPFDLVLLLILSNAVQNSMNGGDNSILGGAVSAVTLVALNYFVGFLTFKSKILEAIIEGRPVMLIHNGQVDHKALNCVRMTTHELNASLRANGCAGPHEVMVAVLENSGEVTVIAKHNHDAAVHPHPAAMAPSPSPPSPPRSGS